MVFASNLEKAPSTSSFSLSPNVFLSFEGEIRRNDFVSHLCRKLSSEGIHAIENLEFLDSQNESLLIVVVITENYVSSLYCLNELVKIIDRWENKGKSVIVPVFYNVNPVQVRDQSGRIGEAFIKHTEIFKDELEKIKSWRDALTKLASICGWHSCHWEDSVLVGQIVRDIADKLLYSSSSDTDTLVGMGSHVKEMEKKLFLTSDMVNTVGIWGMGGIGKTTIAKVMYDLLSSQFEVHCFLENVKDEYIKHGAATLQQKLFSKVLSENTNLNAWTSRTSFNMAKRRLSRKKMLLVLDDVDDLKQLEALVKEPNWFGKGSRIIITTRDKHLLYAHGVNDIYAVQYLTSDQATQLFCQHAFNQRNPKIEYLKLLKQVISYVKGLPLALKVLGAHLNDRTIPEWQMVQDRLSNVPDLKIHDVLRISFDGLDDTLKDAFLDIACFFNGQKKDFAREILEGCGFFPDIAFAVLKDRALITISGDELMMHDLLLEMGRNIVIDESKENPGKRSRLWIPDDIYQVLSRNLGTRIVEGIFLDASKVREVNLNIEAFAKMYSLRLLKFYNTGSKDYNRIHIPDQGLLSISNKLRLFHWEGYPSRSLPLSFHAENLVELYLVGSKVEQLWTGVQHLVNLKRIDLSYSRYLITIPDLSKAQSLERLELGRCQSLVDVSSIFEYLNKLIYLNLCGCTNIRQLSHEINLTSLKVLLLTSCSNLTELPEIFGDIRFICLSDTAIKELPQSIGYLRNLANLSLKNCTRLNNLPGSISKLTSLKSFLLSGCGDITEFPEIPVNVEYLDLSGTTIEVVPSSICSLLRLSVLNLSNCKRLKSFPNCISELGSLRILSLSGCLEIEELVNLKLNSSIVKLELSNCNLFEFPANVSNVSSLEELDLSRNNFERIPASIKQLSQLKVLNVSHCNRLKYFRDIPPCIKVINASHCPALETVPCTKSLWEPNLEYWDFANCFRLDQQESKNILEDAQQIIRLLSSRDRGSRSQFCFPGNEIPEWIRSQDTGGSLTVSLNSNLDQLRAVALCVVISSENPFLVKNVFCKGRFKANDSESNDISFISHFWSMNDKNKTLSFDNMFLWFNSVESNPSGKYNEATFEFCATDRATKLASITKCGVCLIYDDGSDNWPLNISNENFSGGSWKPIVESCSLKRCHSDNHSGNATSDGESQSKRIKKCSF